MLSDQIVSHFKQKFKEHADFFANGKRGDMLVFSNCWKAGSADFNFGDWKSRFFDPDPIIEIPNPLSEQFLKDHAFDFGRELAKDAGMIAEFHYECIQDDWCPGIIFHPGAGYQAAMSTGGDVTFTIGTDKNGGSYASEHVVKNLDNLDGVFNHDNKWIEYALAFWRGVQSCEIDGLTVVPRYDRTPLDTAWELRGDEILYDLYDDPAGVKRLLDRCADSIVQVDKIMRSESLVLREHPGGAQGVAFGCPTIILNGDPLDIISDDMVREFNNPPMKKVTEYAPATLLHHHSVGIARAKAVSEIPNLTVQEIYQDPNGPRIADCITDELIEASLRTPIFIEFPGSDVSDFGEMKEKLSQGRFIVHLYGEDAAEARSLVERLRSA